VVALLGANPEGAERLLAALAGTAASSSGTPVATTLITARLARRERNATM
jgi:hypothetical protein